MKIKKISITEEDTAFGIRMVPDSIAACVPKISGLYLQDDNLDWKATSITVSV